MKRRMISFSAVVLLIAAFFIGCGDKTSPQSSLTPIYTTDIKEEDQKPVAIPQPTSVPVTEAMDKVSAGFVYIGDNYETELLKLNVQTLMAVSSIQINSTILQADADNPLFSINELIDEGCNIIFMSGIDESFIVEAAKEHPDVNFEIYGGFETNSLENVSAFYIRLYQQQYLNGMIAGFVSGTGNIAYMGEKADNEDIRRVNAFALGAKTANPDAIIHFIWQGEDSDNQSSNETLQSMLEKNCDVLMQFEINDAILEFAKANDIMIIGKTKSEFNCMVKMIEPTLFEYIINKVYSTANRLYESNDIYEGWVGIQEYQINADDYPLLSADELMEVQSAMNKMADKTWDVFTGPITDTYGNTIIPEGFKIPDEDLFYMLWYVKNVEALSPPMG